MPGVRGCNCRHVSFPFSAASRVIVQRFSRPMSGPKAHPASLTSKSRAQTPVRIKVCLLSILREPSSVLAVVVHTRTVSDEADCKSRTTVLIIVSENEYAHFLLD